MRGSISIASLTGDRMNLNLERVLRMLEALLGRSSGNEWHGDPGRTRIDSREDSKAIRARAELSQVASHDLVDYRYVHSH